MTGSTIHIQHFSASGVNIINILIHKRKDAMIFVTLDGLTIRDIVYHGSSRTRNHRLLLHHPFNSKILSNPHPSHHPISILTIKTPIQWLPQIPLQSHHIFPCIHIIPFIYEGYRNSHTRCSFQSRPRHLSRTPWNIPEQFRHMTIKPDQVISSVQTRADHGIRFIKTFQTVIDVPRWQVWTVTIQNDHFFISLLKKRSRYICQLLGSSARISSLHLGKAGSNYRSFSYWLFL